jgi:hypothetical protein
MSSGTSAFSDLSNFTTWQSPGRGGMRSEGDRASWADPYQNGNTFLGPGGRQARFPHIKDLQDQAACLEVEDGASVHAILTCVHHSLN